jgi:hypothetical protein
LGQNLEKSLTIEQMMQYNTRGTSSGLLPHEVDSIQEECLELVSKRTAESGIYLRKIGLEKRMVMYLQNNNPELKQLKCEFFTTNPYLRDQTNYVPGVWSEFA